MPTCLRAVTPEKRTEEEAWREPPGYLGEAVRRAKQIPAAALQTQAPPPEGLPPPP